MNSDQKQFEELFNIAMQKYAKRSLISVHHQISFFIWKFVDRYPQTIKTDDTEVYEIVSSLIVELDKKFAALYENV